MQILLLPGSRKESFALEGEAMLIPTSGTAARKAVATSASLAWLSVMHRARQMQGGEDTLGSLGDPHSAPS